MLTLSKEQLMQALRRAFEEGWNSTGQGCNAEHHSLSSESLAEMRDDAVVDVLTELGKELAS